MLPEEDRATATGDLHNEFHEDRASSSRDMLYTAPLPGQSKYNNKIYLEKIFDKLIHNNLMLATLQLNNNIKFRMTTLYVVQKLL